MTRPSHIICRLAVLVGTMFMLMSCAAYHDYDSDIDFMSESGLRVNGIVYGVLPSDASTPIKGIRVVLGMYYKNTVPILTDTTYTDERGFYSVHLNLRPWEFGNDFLLVADDVDGADNSSWSSGKIEMKVNKESQTYDEVRNEYLIDGGNFFLTRK